MDGLSEENKKVPTRIDGTEVQTSEEKEARKERGAIQLSERNFEY